MITFTVFGTHDNAKTYYGGTPRENAGSEVAAMRGVVQEMAGQRFGCTVVVAKAGMRWGRVQWLCRCDCGTEHVSDGAALRRGAVRSCGCRAAVTHGEGASSQRTPEYRAWISMHQRCSNPKEKRYHRYGGRGIRVCDRWESYENFLADMGRRPGPGYSIDRKDNDRGYEPGNCRWATAKEQANNQTHPPHGPDGKFTKARR